MRKTILVLTGILLVSQALASPTAPAAKGTKPHAGTGSPAEKLLSDEWYTVTINGTLHYGYYNDRVAVRGGKLFFQNRYWKKEEDFINEEQVGAYAEDNAELTPLFFNFHSTYRANELTVDGTITDRRMTVKIKRGGSQLPIVRKDLPRKAFLEIFFPVWLNRNESQLSPGKSLAYVTIFEDAVEDGFPTITGRVKRETPDEFVQKSGARKFTVEVKGIKSIWWFDAKGVPLRIEMPQQHTVVERVSESQAQSFLSGP